jgi:Mg-chelatase subunit ChlD
VVAVAAAAGFACSSSERGDDDDDDDAGEAGETSQNQSGRGGATGAGGNPGAGGSLSVGGGISVAGSVGNAGGGGLMTCAGEVAQAMQVPLDIYIMLDSSASMLDETSGGATKWQAVTNALATFLEDPQSSGMSVGLQFFPLRDPSVPTTCTSNAECGSHGPCFLTFCQNAGPDIYPCTESSECVTASGEDVGPCTPLTYCWSIALEEGEVVLCHNDDECGGGAGDCVPFAQCSENTDYSCSMIGSSCSDGVEDFGECEAFNPESFCVHESSCENATYAAADVDIDALPGAAADLTDAISAHEPDGNTPTAPALAGAIEHAADWARDHVGHRVIALLATDGLPTECLEDPEGDPEGVDQVLEVAAAGLDGDPSITTYVVGVFAPTDTEARGNLNDIAEAGGSESAFLVDTTGNVEEEFLAALDAIRGTGLACEFQIPAPSAGSTLDYSFVNVEFTSGGTTQQLFFVADESACDATTGGWYYDIAPSDGTPTKIIACPASCSTFQAATDGSVAIRLGCQTVVR